MGYLFKKLLLLSFLLATFASAGFESALKKQKFLSPEEAFQVTAVLKQLQLFAYRFPEANTRI